MNVAIEYPPEHASFLERCHAAGQTQPTATLAIRGWRLQLLHQESLREHVFPLQVAILLSEPSATSRAGVRDDEQRPRMQSRPWYCRCAREPLVFAVHRRPVQGTRACTGSTSATGQSGARRSPPHRRIIFHDAT